MRRKISLYIAEQLVDLDDQSFILFNYQMDELSNPTIVKNSFSQQITLKGTPVNNSIFGDFFRTDRRNGIMGGNSGADFNASKKTPFTIFNEMGEILESGYVKLDSITRNGADIQYKVTLYGGLGSFFYALSYDENGNKRTLADIDYLGTGNPDSELDFIISANAVTDAWERLKGDTSVPAMWDIINFAPAYNGVPDSNFSPGKGLIIPGDAGLPASVTRDDVTYTTRGAFALVNLAEEQDEWAVKDLRSYMQRPVLSMNAFLAAICNPVNNGGYEVDASIVRDYLQFGKYADLWMTLPMISSIDPDRQRVGDLSLIMSSVYSSGNNIGRYDVDGLVPSGGKVIANLSCRVRFNMPAAASGYSTLSISSTYPGNVSTNSSVIFIQAVAYSSDGVVVGGSKIKCNADGDLKEVAEACRYVPAYNNDYEHVDIETFNRVSSGVFEIPEELGFHVEARDVAYYQIMVYVYPCVYTTIGNRRFATYYGDGSTSTPAMYAYYDTGWVAYSAYIVQGAMGNTISCTSADSLRSGAAITKSMLLSSSHTPAEYLLSFCKIFGLYFTYDNATKKVTILRRNDLYQNETIDLSKRVDRAKGISIRPMVFDAKWYDFSLEGVGGAFYDEYEKVQGIPYGIQRVNTGYDFNSDSVNLMDSVVFKNACTILARSRYFNSIFKIIPTEDPDEPIRQFQPSPFIDNGNTYTLYSLDGDTIDLDISCPPYSAEVTYYNDDVDLKGYDINSARKLEMRTPDNKPIDGADVLVFLEGFNNYDYFKVTDDVAAMDYLNDGVPCWLLGAGDGGENSLSVPSFQRYFYGAESLIEDSLDFGYPKQLDIPGVRFAQGVSIYERGWAQYMVDRYDANTKVMTCHVDFSGIQVGQGLLRKFYWYDNSLWVLNKIKNYSLTTFDPVECEFVQVQDKNNYLNGQSY